MRLVALSLYGTLSLSTLLTAQTSRIERPRLVENRTRELGVEWLARHQDHDGRWSAARFMLHDPAIDRCSGAGDSRHDLRVTAFAVLAMLANGSTLRSGAKKEAIRRGVTWIKGRQQKNGLLRCVDRKPPLVDHMIATLALLDAYRLSDYRALKRCAQSSVDFIEAARNPDGGWALTSGSDKSHAISTVWALWTLRWAQTSGVGINSELLSKSENWLEKHRDEITGRSAALVLMARFASGHEATSGSALQAHAERIVKSLPQNSRSADIHDYFFGTVALFWLGGRHWKEWKRGLATALAKRQCKKGSAAGSWDPSPSWQPRGGRVEATALSVLCLSLHDRYTAILRK